MAIGAEDYIDQLLVQKYALEKVDNHDTTPSMVNPEKMMEAMTDYASMSRNMFTLNQKLTQTCAALNATSVKYKKATFLKYDEYYGEYYQATEEDMQQAEIEYAQAAGVPQYNENNQYAEAYAS